MLTSVVPQTRRSRCPAATLFFASSRRTFSIRSHGRARRSSADWALDTLQHDHSLRAARLQAVLTMPPRQRAIDALAPEPGTLRRTIYDARRNDAATWHSLCEPRGTSRAEIAAVNEAYDGLGATYSLLLGDLPARLDRRRRPAAGRDRPLRPAATTTPSGTAQRMIFGDGDGELFNRFTISLDVIGHELTHGVTQYDAPTSTTGSSQARSTSRCRTSSARWSSSTRSDRRPSRPTG